MITWRRSVLHATAAVVAGALLLSPLSMTAQAVEQNTVAPTVSGQTVTQTQPSGLTADYVFNSDVTAVGTGQGLSSKGGAAGQFTPSGVNRDTSAIVNQVNINGCTRPAKNATVLCTNRGALTVNFNHPITDPVMHLSGLGGSSTVGTSALVYNATLKPTGSTPSGASGTVLSGTNLSVGSDGSIKSTNPKTSANCGTTLTTVASQTVSDGATAGCGSVRFSGTYTSITFQMDMQITCITGGTDCTGVGNGTGQADEYVSLFTNGLDFGDAPTSYNGTVSDSAPAAQHVFGGLKLGSGITEDSGSALNPTQSPVANSTATGDTDDAFTSLPDIIAQGTSTYSLTVPLSGTSKAGTVAGWIDFNKNGVFDTGERAAATFAANASSATLSFSKPSGLSAGGTFARFRTAFTASDVANPNGRAASGEVEDYPVTIVNESATVDFTKSAGAVQDTNGNGLQDAGDQVTYTFSVTNTGNTSLSSVAISDPKISGVTCSATTLAPGASTTCTGTYTLTQADVTAGTVANTATVTATSSTGASVSKTATANRSITQTTRATLAKTAGPVVDANSNGRTDVGDTIAYSFLATNTGNQPITSLTVNDAKIGSVTCATGTLAPGASRTCTATYTLTQADVDAGQVANSATVSVTSAAGSFTSPASTATRTFTGTKSFNFNKSAGGIVDANSSGTVNAGDTITYTFTFTNTGSTTLNGPTVTDAKVGAVSCTTGTVAPNASVTCTKTYTLTQADVDAGAVNNTATGAIKDPSGTALASKTDSTSTAVTPNNTLAIVKSASAPNYGANAKADPGDTITYSFTITNTGGSTLSSPTVVDPTLGNLTCSTGSLAPGAQVTCSKVYAMTQADIDAGRVDNSATATATRPNGATVTSTPSTASTAITRAPAVTFNKAAGSVVDANSNGRTDPGDTIAYTFTINNSGNVTLNGIGVTDPKTGPVSCASTTLAVGATLTCTKTYTLTQTDIDAGAVNNTATLSATPAGSTTALTRTDSTSTTLATSGTLTLTKTAGAVNDTTAPSGPSTGDTIPYSFVVSNTGTQTLSTVAVTDAKITGPISCPATTLAPGASTTCTATYTLTQADVNAGKVDNTATVSAKRPDGSNVTASSTTSKTIAPTSSFAFNKAASAITDANANSKVDAGDTITYTFTFQNNGATTLSGATVTDAKIGAVTCPTANVAPGASTTCSKVYTLTQADVNAGSVNNTATGTMNPPSGLPAPSNRTDSTSTGVAAANVLQLTKTAGAIQVGSNNRADAGETITYTFTMTNNGNQTLTDVAVSDPKVGPVTCASGSLAPGASTSCSKTYALTQADIDAGTVSNTATATAKSPSNATVTSNTSTVNTTVTAAPGIALAKSAAAPVDVNSNGRTDTGDTITYSFTVTNTGNVTLNPVTVTDTKVGTVTCPTGALAPGATTSCTPKQYTITQTDADAGAVQNTATTSGKPPTGANVTASDSTSTPTTSVSSLSLTKTAGATTDFNGNGKVDAGDRVPYTITVQNTGSRTISSISVTDTKIPTLTCGATSLAAGATTTCTGTYTLTQADVDAGQVVNTATVTGRDPSNATITANGSNTKAIAGVSSFTFNKSAGAITEVVAPAGPSAGDTITYTFRFTNTGTTTLKSPTVTDAKIGAVTCSAAALAPGASVTCTKTYALTQTDVDAGAVNNTATGAMQPNVTGSPTPTSQTDSTSTTVTPTNTLGLVKSAGAPVDANSSGKLDAGDTITYSFVVTNNGGATLNTVAVSDPKVGTVACPTTSLAPGASLTCTKAYTITQADLDAGTIQNSASATAKTPGNATVTSNTSTINTSLNRAPGVGLTKEVLRYTDLNGNGKTDAGDRLSYRFTVTNTGNVTLNPITVTDTKLGGTISCPGAPLAPGASIQCPAVNWLITQAEVDAGSVQNNASVSATTPSNSTVSASASASYPVTRDTSLTVTKTAGAVNDRNGNGTDVGDTIPYTITVTNSGTLSVSSVAVTDPKIPGLTCTPTSLAAGASSTCSGTYTLTQADVDAGQVVNTATATATATGGQAVSATGSSTKTLSPTSSFDFDKSAGTLVDVNDNGRNDAGDRITYTFTFQNTGTTTLRNPVVTDAKLGTVSCPTVNVAPGGTATCSGSYTMTQSDIDSGAVNNTATGAMSGLAGRPDPTPGTRTDTTSTAVSPTNILVLGKSAAAPVDANSNGRVDAGETITYTFTARNDGSQTLSLLQVLDPKVGDITCPTTTINPGATITCTKTYAVTQADIDAGTILNTANASASTPGGQTLTSAPASVSTGIARVPGVALTKTASAPTDVNNNGRVDAGDTITYGFSVRNTGNVTLDPVTVSDPKLGALSCPTSPLTPGGNPAVCTSKVYTITQADVDSGAVQNTATVTAKPPGVAAITNSSSTSTSTTVTPTVSLTKVAGNVVDSDNNGPDEGDLLPYTFTVTNTGTTTLSSIAITDSKISGNVTCNATTLTPNQSTTCTGNHVLTQAEVDAGQVLNTASVTATRPGGGTVSASASATKSITPVSQFTFKKNAGTLVDVDNSGSATPGDTIPYTFVFTNTGTTTLSSAAVSDAKIGPVTCAATAVPPGGQISCTKSYAVTQNDIDAGAVNNTATGSMSAGANVPQPAPHSDTVSTQLQGNPTLVFTKTAATPNDANGNNRIDAGETITYTFTTRNTGNVTLTLLQVDDPAVGPVTCSQTTLTTTAPGNEATCTKVYTLTQADVNAGGVVNTASASAQNPQGVRIQSPTSTATSSVEAKPGMAFSKQAGQIVDANDNGKVDRGDTITYSFAVENTGNVSLSGISVSDPKVGQVSCAAGALAPGSTRTCDPVVYTLTQADVDSGSVNNSAEASATTPTGATLTRPGATSTPVTRTSTLTAVKTPGTLTDPDDNGPDVGDVLPYTFTLTNTGTTTLSTVGVLDEKISASAFPCSPATLQPGQTATCSGSYVLTQVDVDAGKVDNSALGQARDPQGTLIQSAPATATKTFTPISAFQFNKAVTPIDLGADNRPSPGDTVTYTFTFANTGGTTLSAPTVTDPRAGTVTCPTGDVAPGTSVSCTKTYALTQADIDAGSINNTATGTMTAPSTAPQPASRTDSTSTPIAGTNALAMVKTAAAAPADTNSSGKVDAGDRLTYTFQVTNNGNLTVNSLAIVDPKIPSVSCTATSLAPGATTSCTGSYALTQADLDEGQVSNSARATATDSQGGSVQSPVSSVDKSLTQATSVFIDKATGATSDTNGNGVFDAGDTIVYTFELRNTGTVTLSDVTVADPKVGPVTCPTGDLAPNQVRTCSPITYTVTSADIAAGAVQNTATVTAKNPAGTTTTASDSTSTGVQVKPVANPDVTSGKQGQTQSVRPLSNDTPGDPTVPLMANTLTLMSNGSPVSSATISGQGTYTLSGGAIVFQPVSTFVGTATPVTYRVADQRGNQTSSTYTPTVTAVTPIARDDSSTGLQGRLQTLDVLANDSAGDSSAPLVPSSLRLLDGTTPVLSLTVANVGTYTVDSGVVKFQPLPGYTGSPAAVRYRVADANGTTAAADLRVTVTGVSPTANDDTRTASQGVPLPVDVLANDTAGAPTVPLDPASLRLLDAGGNPVLTRTLTNVGTFTVSDGQITFTSAPQHTGTVPAVRYRVADVNGTTADANIRITVSAVTPTARDDESVASQGRAQTVTPLANDSAGSDDVPLVPSTLTLLDGGSAVTSVTVANQGTYTLNANRTITFQPLPEYTGTPTPVSYRVADANGTTATAQYRPRVTPVTRPDTSGGLQGRNQQVGPVLNDTVDPNVTLDPGTLKLRSPQTGQPVDSVTIAGQGTYTVVSGTIVFAPVAAFTGQATPVTYLADDQVGTTLANTYTPTVTPLNPGVNPDVASGPQGLPLTVTPLANDTPGDPGTPLDPTTLTLLNAAGNAVTSVTVDEGTYTLNGDRTITFTPVKTFVGTATSVRYRVADANGTTATSTYTPTLTPVSPTANPDTATGPQGRPLAIDPLANDDAGNAGVPLDAGSLTLLDGAGAAVSSVTVTGGTYTLTSGNRITFTPTATFVGTAPLVRYRVADANGTTTTSTYTPTITRVTPTATDDLTSGTQGAPQTVTPLANDSAGDPAVQLDPATLTLLDGSGNPATSVTTTQGTYTLNANRTITFQPLPAYSGEPTAVRYRVADTNGTTATASYQPEVAPVTRPDATTGRQGAAQTVQPLVNDTLSPVTLVPGTLRLVDPADGQAKTSVTTGAGTYTVSGGAITFQPLTSYVGTTTPLAYRVADSAGNVLQDTYTATVTAVSPGAKDDATTGPQGRPQSVDPLINDVPGDPDVPFVPSTLTLLNASGQPATTVTVTEGSYALANGRITFTPNASFVGTATPVTYRVADANGTPSQAQYRPTTTAVTPIAVDDASTGLQGAVQAVDPFLNDSPGDPDVPLARGSLTLLTSGGTPATEVSVTGGVYRVGTGGTITFTPTGSYTGTPTPVDYRIADANGTTARAKYQPQVTGVTPTAVDDPIAGKQGQPTSVRPLANDSAGDPAVPLVPSTLTLLDGSTPATTVTIANEGTYTLSDGLVSFQPVPGFTGTGTGVRYRVQDTNGTAATATIRPTYGAVTPDARDDSTSGRQGAQQSVNPLTNDLPGDPSAPLAPSSLTLLDGTTPTTSVTVPNEGTYVLNLDRSITFTPVPAFTGTGTGVVYRVADSNGTTDTARYRPTVTAVTPVLTPDESSGKQGLPQSVAPLNNDTPGNAAVPLVPSTLTLLDGAGAAATTVTSSQGRFVLNPDRTITFTPVGSFTGTADPVRYRVADANGTTAISSYTPTVTGVTPTARDDESTGKQGATQTFTPLSNDTAGDAQVPLVPSSLRLVDPADGQAKTSVTIAGEGTYTVNPDATVTFTPVKAFRGAATPLSYRVADANGTTATARLLATVTAITPTAEDDAAAGVQGRSITVLPLSNDRPGDPDVPLVASTLTLLDAAGDPATSVTISNQGTYTLSGDRITFTPLPAFTGEATPVRYRVADANGTTATARVLPTISGVAPVAVDDASTGLQGATQSVDPLANDRPGDAAVPLDPTSLTLLTSAGQPTAGPVQVAGGRYELVDGRIVFTPEPDFTGAAPAVRYRVADVNGSTATAAYRPSVGRVVPVANDDTSTGRQGATQSVNPLANDTAGDPSVPLVPSTLTLLDGSTPATSVTVPGEGTYTLEDGRIVFTPVGSFTGTATGVTYRIADANGTTAAATYAPRTTAVLPTALDDVSAGRQGAVQSVDPLANDRPGDDAVALVPSTLTLLAPGSGAPVTTVTIDGEGTYTLVDGRIRFEPVSSFSGEATPVRYQVADANGTLASARYTPTVTGVDPTALNDVSSGLQNQTQSVEPLANDVPGDEGVPLDPTTLTLLDAAGDPATTVTVDGEGVYTLTGTTITFDPEAGFTGDATPVRYRVADRNGTTTTALYTPTVIGVNPAAVDDSSVGKQGVAQSVDPLANDRPGEASAPLVPSSLTLLGADGQPTTSVTVDGQGRYTLEDGRIVFTPERSFVGTSTPVTYRIADENGSTDTATYTAVVQRVTPTALADQTTGPQGSTQTVSPVDNDLPGDPSAPILASTLTLLTSGGQPTDSIVLDGVGRYDHVGTTIVFTPLTGFTGTAPAVTYRVADTNGTTATSTYTARVTAVTPTAIDDASTGRQGAAQSVNPLANDTAGAEDVPLVPSSVRLIAPGSDDAVTSVTIAGQGRYTVADDGRITFTPVDTFTGQADPVTYRVADANGTTARAVYRPTVTAVTPVATDDSSSGVRGQAQSVDPLANDRAGDPDVPLVPGSLTLLSAGGSPTTTVTISGQGTYTLEDGRIVFTPVASFVGTPTPVTYRVADANGTTATAAYRPTVGATAPVAADDTSTGKQGRPQSVDPLANDTSDPSSPFVASTLTLLTAAGTPTTQPVLVEGGRYELVDGRIRFTPDADFVGPAPEVRYRVADGQGRTVEAGYAPTVTAVTPTAVDDASSGPLGAQQSVRPTANDVFDADVPFDGTSLRLIDPVTGQPTTGTVTVTGGSYRIEDGRIVFTPAAGFTGTPTAITYQIADVNGTTARAVYRPTVTTISTTTTPDTTSGPIGRAQSVNPLANDSFDAAAPANPSTLRLLGAAGQPTTSVTVPGVGTYTIEGSRIVFRPVDDFVGTAPAVTYRVADVNGNEFTSTYTPTVTPAEEIVENVSRTAAPGEPVTFDPVSQVPGLVPSSVRLIDPRTGDQVLRLVVAGQGVWTVDPDTGRITFTPAEGFTGNPTPVDYVGETEDGAPVSGTLEVVYEDPGTPDPPDGGADGGGGIIGDLLPGTGASELALPIGVLGLLLVGAGLVVVRRKRPRDS